MEESKLIDMYLDINTETSKVFNHLDKDPNFAGIYICRHKDKFYTNCFGDNNNLIQLLGSVSGNDWFKALIVNCVANMHVQGDIDLEDILTQIENIK